MAIKKKAKTKVRTNARKKAVARLAKPIKRTAKATKKSVKPARKPTTKKIVRAVAKRTTKSKVVAKQVAKPVAKVPVKFVPKPLPPLMPPPPVARPILRTVPRQKVKVRQSRPATMSAEERNMLHSMRIPQFTYMKAPGAEYVYDVGDTVEVFCDHERNNDRVRGWIKGIVVQVDNKMVAVQFRSNVFLTDGWMVPDRILWYPVMSDQIRAASTSRKGSKKEIPDY